ncbi:MAG: PAS domain S-box protein [Bacteroidetes bacterium]|nr:PAS domain S-box protein [Bacteroidota bacterium]
MKEIIILLLCFTGALYSLVAQHDFEPGRPFITNYSHREYNGHPQNWCIIQDSSGLIYIGNNQDLMQFDGVGWNFIETPFSTPVRALAKDSKGRIYTGAKNEIGFLGADPEGKISYISLTAKLQQTDKEFGDIRRVEVTEEDNVFFIGNKKILCYNGDTINTWTAESNFRYGYYVMGNMFVWQEGYGLMRLDGDSLITPESGLLLKDKVVQFLLPYNEETMLAGTRNDGLFLVKNFHIEDTKKTVITPLETQMDDYFRENGLYHGIRMRNGTFVLATDFGGVIIIGKNGIFLRILNKKTGLNNETINYVYEDDYNNLWIALNIGIAHVSLNYPVNIFGEETGLNGMVISIARHKKRLYVATMQDIFYLQTSDAPTLNREPNYHFVRVKGLSNSCMHLETTGDRLLAATAVGLFEVIDDRAVLIDSYNTGLYLHRYLRDTSFLFASVSDGLILYKITGRKYERLGYIKRITGDTRRIWEDPFGNIWTGDQYKGLIALKYAGCNVGTDPEIFKADSACGLPPFTTIATTMIGNKLLAVIDSGLYSCRITDADPRKAFFTKETELPERFDDSKNLIPYSNIAETGAGDLWLNASRRIIKLERQKDHTYKILDTPFKRLPSPTTFFAFYFDTTDNQLWFGGSDGLFCYLPDKPCSFVNRFRPLIREVTVGKDSIIKSRSEVMIAPEESMFIPYTHNQLSIKFALPFFDKTDKTEYSWFLKGFSEEWSDWSAETKSVFTNLPEGTYLFRIRAKNVFGTESSEASYAFEILPPWYKTWWAYLIFLTFFIVLIRIVIRLYIRRLKLANLRLENTITERTREIRLQKEELERINDELVKLSIVARETDNAVMIMDTQGNFEWINEGFTRLYGYTLAQLITEKSFNIQEYSRNIYIKNIFTECITGKQTMIYESEIITRDGEKKWTQTTLTPVQDNQNQVIKIVAIDSDIQKLKHAEEEIHRQKEEIQSQRDKLEDINKQLEKLSIVASETDNAVIIMDAEGNFEWINESLTRIYGYTLEEFIEKKGRNIIHSSSNANISQILDDCIRGKKTIVYDSLTNTASGKTIWTQTTLTPILDKEGIVTKIVAIDTDITKIKKAELEILKQKEQIQAQSDLLGQANKELERNNMLVTDSIKYAKHIQEAILPSKRVLKSYLPDSFIFLKPRDIVSGDFYWFHIEGNRIIIAIADCTGHGVPGAFMSIIGNTLLNEIVKEKKIVTPAVILDRLNTKVIDILKQGDSTADRQDDGMDISICSIDLEKKQLQVACANHKVLIVNGNDIQTIAGDIYSIGGIFSKSAEDFHFKNHKTGYSKGSTLYMFTDGFQDQFGGLHNSKFMAGRFEKLLTDNCSLSIRDQLNNLEITFESWKGHRIQMDDVLVLGVRLP